MSESSGLTSEQRVGSSEPALITAGIVTIHDLETLRACVTYENQHRQRAPCCGDSASEQLNSARSDRRWRVSTPQGGGVTVSEIRQDITFQTTFGEAGALEVTETSIETSLETERREPVVTVRPKPIVSVSCRIGTIDTAGSTPSGRSEIGCRRWHTNGVPIGSTTRSGLPPREGRSMVEHRPARTRRRRRTTERLGYTVAVVWLSCWTLGGTARIVGVLAVSEFLL